MPAFYAHYKFGQMVKNKLPAKYQRLLEDYQDLYEIGLHGPDILFFYHPIIRHPITQIGVAVSYTHLDVYKRQRIGCLCNRCKQEAYYV